MVGAFFHLAEVCFVGDPFNQREQNPLFPAHVSPKQRADVAHAGSKFRGRGAVHQRLDVLLQRPVFGEQLGKFRRIGEQPLKPALFPREVTAEFDSPRFFQLGDGAASGAFSIAAGLFQVAGEAQRTVMVI